MNTNLWSLNWHNVLSAAFSGAVSAVLAYLAGLTNIFVLDFKQVASIAIIAFLTSVIKAFSSDSNGKVLGRI